MLFSRDLGWARAPDSQGDWGQQRVLEALYALQPQWPADPPLLRLLAGSLPGLMLIVIIFAGVRSGVFTATESACVAVIYALFVTVLVYRGLRWEGFLEAVGGAVRTTGMVMLIIGTAASFGWLMALMQVPAQTVALMRGLTEDPLLASAGLSVSQVIPAASGFAIIEAVAA